MTYTDLFLRADTEAALKAALPAFMLDDEGNVMSGGQGWALDWNVPVVSVPAVHDAETGEAITPAVMDTRFHANLCYRPDMVNVEIASAYVVAPVTPQRVFA